MFLSIDIFVDTRTGNRSPRSITIFLDTTSARHLIGRYITFSYVKSVTTAREYSPLWHITKL
ncbi:MAG: hypothetical protein A4E62_00161 [Syntrophorhabdus sp. PtaU1.Bin002]|nr:MAG: hypothetical protein A4E58_00316 [Syntrophorhabdus sp. PtaB.Bin006]OPY73894.1 MAG: hypothetical protein A4E62_00161 [Syntrophorhabdus sp. PtaU1.Bin002]